MERQRFTGLMDMLDGGGAGAEGNEFQGGGLLSDIGNALFQPAGYRERMRGMQEMRPRMRPPSLMTGGVMTGPDPEPLPTRPRSRPTQGAPAPMSQPTPQQPGPMMPGGPTPPMPAPQMQPGPGMPGFDQPMPMPERAAPQTPPTPQQPGPMMPGGPQQPMPIDQAMAQLEGVLTPSERQTLQGMSPEQRMSMIQRLIQMRQGGM